MTATGITQNDLKSALPDVSSDLSMKGIDGPIEILRDRLGIPHVRAESAHDAFFGQGYATTQDRLWHMECDRRRATGRWAEYVGPGALEQDRFMRRFRLGASAKADYEVVKPETRAMLQAYADGVNAFIGATANLPVEYGIVEAEPEPWHPWHSLAVFKARHILMGVFEGKIWRAKLVNHLGPGRAAELLSGYEAGHLLTVPPGGLYSGPAPNGLKELLEGAEAVSPFKNTDAGSNNWVLDGRRTASGKPLLAGDPHRGLDTPNVYYQNHVSCPDFDVVGLSFPGVPGFPHFGHNAWVAWCVTHAMADYQDLYIERFQDGDPTRYLADGEYQQADVHRESINVRGGQPEQLDVTVTRHGPVILGDPSAGHGLAFKYTATAEPINAADTLLEMLKAQSIEEMDESMRDWVDPCNNLLFSDVHGGIQYLTRGKVPVRSFANAWLPVPGWTGEHEWQGMAPFEEMPRSRNPEDGYIVTANHRIVDEDFPHYIGLDYYAEFRARRIKERLDRIEKATVEDMAAVHSDDVSIPGAEIVALLSNASPKTANALIARDKLVKWDGSMHKDGIEPTLFSAFRDVLVEKVAGYTIGPLAEEALSGVGRGGPQWLHQLGIVVRRYAREGDNGFLPKGRSWGSVMAEALEEATARLRDRLGDKMSSWTWGSIHTTRPRHTLSPYFPEASDLLDPPSVPMSGDGDTPLAASYDMSDPFVISSTSVARYVFDLADWNNSRWVVPLGSSGHPGSTHFADQAVTWSEVKLLPMLYDWERIEAEAESRQTLNPGS